MDLNFTNATFIENVRFDNMKCNNLIFKDTNFLDGGGIKNRDENNALHIKYLEFRPYRLSSDFVIDIGNFANKNGILEPKSGTIETIKFENLKIGNSKIYFVGLNNKFKSANFRNMILDNVVFQNSDLSNCYFLNATINKTEFRNCKFPMNENRLVTNEILGKVEVFSFILFAPLFFLLTHFLLTFLDKDFFSFSPNYVESPMMLFLSVIIIFLLAISMMLILLSSFASINLVIEAISWLFRKILNVLNLKDKLFKTFHMHHAIADEKLIYKNFEDKKDLINSSLLNLTTTYSQLKNNFKDTDF